MVAVDPKVSKQPLLLPMTNTVNVPTTNAHGEVCHFKNFDALSLFVMFTDTSFSPEYFVVLLRSS